MSDIQELISRYEKGAQVFEDALRGLPPDELDRLPGPGKWTIRQIAIHLADGEIVSAARLRYVAGQPNSKLYGYNQELWATNLGYETQPIEPALAVMRAVRQATVIMLRSLPESAWSRTGFHEERGELSLRALVELIADHTERHARQIREHRARFAAVA